MKLHVTLSLTSPTPSRLTYTLTQGWLYSPCDKDTNGLVRVYWSTEAEGGCYRIRVMSFM